MTLDDVIKEGMEAGRKATAKAKKKSTAPQLYVVSQEGDVDNVKWTIVHLASKQIIGRCDDYGQASLIVQALNEWAAGKGA